MANDSTLMAHLIPKLTSQVENAATDALAYILNRSTGAMQALNDLLREGGLNIEPIARAETQVTYKDGSRPDMAGYDEGNVVRLLVEAKFWAALLEGQASGYIEKLDQPGPAVLLFIAPEARTQVLWSEIRRQMEKQYPLRPLETRLGVQRAVELGSERHVLLVSWNRILDRMAALAEDAGVQADIRQLRGLAQRQDSEAFLPLHAGDLSPSFGRRVIGYNRLVDDAVDGRGVREEWMSIRGTAATAQRYGYGRYFRFDALSEVFLWFGVNHEMWATEADTPLWLRVLNVGGHSDWGEQDYVVQGQDRWIPIHPKVGVEYQEVLDDVASQLKTIAKILSQPPSTEAG